MTQLLPKALLIAMGIGLFVPNPSVDQAVDPGKYQPELAKLVASYLNYYHYSQMPLDDVIAERSLDLYLQALDFNRMFFLASDIRSFRAFEDQLDDDLRSDHYTIDKPFTIYNRFRQRVAERVDKALQLLDSDFDFNLDESIAVDRSEEAWAESVEVLNDLWRKRIKEQMLRFKLQGKSDEDSRSLLRKRYERLKKDIFENESMDVLERYLSSLAQSFDPHSQYFKPATKDNFDIDMGHSLEGIGATLRTEGEYTIIVELIPGGPAARSGELKPNDKIIAVAQGDEEPVDVVDLRIDRVVKYIRGKKGTEVRLTVIPADAIDESQTKIVRLIRDKVMITANDAKGDVREWRDDEGQLHRFGVLTVPSFYMDTAAKFRGDPNFKSTTRDVRKILDDLEGKDVEAIVIDLRNNAGGSLDEAVELTGLFIRTGPVVQVKSQNGRVKVLQDPDPDQIYDGPLVVLTNVFSASASEIFAGAIEDYGRGLIVGDEATHGKGTVQNVIDLDPSLERVLSRNLPDKTAGALKLTTHVFYRVSGSSTQMKGVAPHVVLPSPFDRYEFGEEHLEYALPWDRIDAVPFHPCGLVPEETQSLQEKSLGRIAKDPEFQYLKEDYAEWLKRKEENRVSLNEAVRKKEQDELDALEEQRKQERMARAHADAAKTDVEGSLADGEAPDFILNEALNICADYVRLVKKRVVVAGAENKDVSAE